MKGFSKHIIERVRNILQPVHQEFRTTRISLTRYKLFLGFIPCDIEREKYNIMQGPMRPEAERQSARFITSEELARAGLSVDL